MSNAAWDQIAGMWKQIKGDVRAKWGELTDDDLEYIDGKRENLAGRIQEKYGLTKEDANKQIDDWTKARKY